ARQPVPSRAGPRAPAWRRRGRVPPRRPGSAGSPAARRRRGSRPRTSRARSAARGAGHPRAAAPRSERPHSRQIDRGLWPFGRSPVDERGGNSRFTAGAIRVVYNGLDDLVKLMPDLTDEEKRNSDFGVYTSDQYFDDLARVTQDRANPDMAELLITRSFETLS